MPLLDSNLRGGTDPRLQQQSMGGMPPSMGGMPPSMGGIPQLPPSLAAQLMQRAQMRSSPQGNPLLGATMAQPPQTSAMMTPFQPSELPKPKEFWEQQSMPTEGMRSNSMMGNMPREAGIGMPGQLPQMGTPQIPDNMQGMGLGATAPQMMGGMPNAAQDFSKQINAPGMASLGMPGGQQQEDPMGKLKNQMFGAYLNLYPEGNL